MYMVLFFWNENIFVGFQIFLWGSMYECKMSLCINSNGSTSLKLRQKCSHYEGKEGRFIFICSGRKWERAAANFVLSCLVLIPFSMLLGYVSCFSPELFSFKKLRVCLAEQVFVLYNKKARKLFFYFLFSILKNKKGKVSSHHIFKLFSIICTYFLKTIFKK